MAQFEVPKGDDGVAFMSLVVRDSDKAVVALKCDNRSPDRTYYGKAVKNDADTLTNGLFVDGFFPPGQVTSVPVPISPVSNKFKVAQSGNKWVGVEVDFGESMDPLGG